LVLAPITKSLEMNSRVAVRNDGNGIVVLIKPRPGHFITVIALCCIALVIVLSGVSFFTAVTAWGAPMLGIAFFEIWQNFAQQRIFLYGNKIRIERWLWSFRLGDAVKIDASNICNVDVEQFSYKSKGGSYVSRTLVFSSKSGVVARSWQLSSEDGRNLLEGPFKRFVDEGRFST
jgi:hypothetical protein